MDMADRVEQAMVAAPREGFLLQDQRRRGGVDAPLPIGRGQTNSQPSTVRQMLELLDVRQGQSVLDVGAGSGWTTALLAHLTGPSGSVVGVERIPELAELAASNVQAADLPWARVLLAVPGQLGAPAYGPFDRILVSAVADDVPRALVEQLAPHGVMVVPVRGRMARVRLADDGPAVDYSGYYSFVPLVEDEGDPGAQAE